ncbi:MAG TPA: DegQ family serine endoprotease [Deltaproteobacteria bacterium]|jgi:Do/DeqQ family serine protease|nr:DegQ family serine endoprotease [Deltaproteobacteria bacterium]HRW79436.1 DegQ family serine endoprotease [Desulfomonilia bacterium]HNQ85243.1 DegQ family serine endoprotease [Deltaproteobacteria bacterium]HNS89516.1 DegQ family serine endoprotease [Deltaproteobacteria bacterium]HOA44322.1 DegQ family serine endoprotease [Deltaproteobacteria bacterium]
MARTKVCVVFTALVFCISGIASAEQPNPYEGDWVADIAAEVLPSVVNISSMKTVAQQSPLFSDPFFREFFGGGIPRERVQRALGSGVIVSSDGYIVTNNHVVGGADKVEVRLSDARVFQAVIVGTDPKSDLAVIKISKTGLPAIKIGDSSKLRIGDFVLAVGNPFGLEQTVTMGIISALGRSGLGITDYENFIQTDAAINPGNSGGALVNMRGELIGINTAILSRTGGNVGIGFAIPVNLAMSIKKSIDKYGKVVRGWLGVMVQEITPELAQSLGLASVKGALINEVMKGSPSEKSGIKRGDVIVAIDGQPVNNSATMRFLISEVMPGTMVKVKVIRDGKERVFPVVIGDLARAQVPEHQILIKDNRFLEGATVADLSPATRETMEVDAKVQGVMVIDVANNSAAARTGLKPGDVILSINSRNTRNLKEFEQVIGTLKGVKMSISIYREGMVMTMTIIR